MALSDSHHFERNPFATRYVRPGAIEYRFLDGQSVQQVVERLGDSHWMGEIIGPHGAGKSTLLQSLIPLIQDANRTIKLFTLHLGQSQLPDTADELKTIGENGQIIVDGYEQLSRASRNQLLKLCRDRGCGLLVTSHEPTGLPTIYVSSPSRELLQTLVRDLQADGPTRVRDADVAMSFERHAGNVRDVLFELYDIFEQRRPV